VTLQPKLFMAALLVSASVLLMAVLAYLGSPGAEEATRPSAMADGAGDGGGAAAEPARGEELPVAPAGEAAAGGAVAPMRLAGGADLLLGLASLDDPRKQEAYLRRVVRSLAALGPDAALARVRQLEGDDLQDMAMLALLQEWSGVSTLELIRSGNIWRFGVEGALGWHLLESGKISPERASAMALATRGANRRAELLAQVAARMAGTDPVAALALADGLDERQKARFIERMTDRLSEQSPAAARELVARSTDPAVRAAMMARLLEAEARQDPVAAARNFSSQPPETPQGRQQAARGIASRWASSDTLAALQWSDSLGDDALREAARRGIAEVAPVGIGARLESGPGGAPLVQGIVPGSPAGASGQIRDGDAILAVSTAAGEWVDARRVRMGELIGLIRGEPDTQVSLQVQSPGEPAPRTVTLGRQQIIHRPQ
jgi:hypothetical protein